MICNPENEKANKFINELMLPSEELKEAKSEIKKSPKKVSDLLSPLTEKTKLFTQDGRELFTESI